jgi:hypothetical protein
VPVGSRLLSAQVRLSDIHDGEDKVVSDDNKFNFRWEVGGVDDQSVR